MRCELDYASERKWERNYLKKKCEELGVEQDYILYTSRLRAYYLGVFLLLHMGCTIFHIAILASTCVQKDLVYIDVICYLTAAVLITAVLWVNLYDVLVSKHIWIMYITSIIAVVILVGIDLTQNLYHYYKSFWVVGSFYDTYVILVIYMFLPIPYIKAPLALGISVSVIYISYFIFYTSAKYRYDLSNATHYNHMSADITHHICLNLLGSFFRIMREIVVRSSFFDRHQYVIEDISLRTAREKEKLFLHSILPPQIAKPIQDDILNRIKLSEKHRELPILTKRDRIMAIQIHPDVTILYADVVNYTHLTTTLTVKNLVTLLHELYARFDMAASRFTVQRIKFLGDCYYCVAGLTMPDPDHAKCCIDLGLCMIQDIREVGAERKVDIDIRVGVHSGSLFAGVLGGAKLQYDIWGTDVVIANRLEATGVPGYIHTSERTLQTIIEHSYRIYPGTKAAVNDPYLIRYSIQTFLIPAIDGTARDTREFSFAKDALSHVPSSLDLKEEEQNKVGQELRNEFKKMPVGPSNLLDKVKEFWGCMDDKNLHYRRETSPLISVYLLHFRDPRLEFGFMHQPDYMLKYSVLLAWCIGFCLVYIQVACHSGEGSLCYYVGGTLMISLSIFVFITWYKTMCCWRYSINEDIKYNRLSCYLFRVAEYIQGSLILRIFIYMYTITGYFFIISVMLLDCNLEEFEMLHIESKLYHYEPDYNMCFHPWVLTNMMCLIIGMSLIFTRIPFVMKMIVSTLEAITYIIIMFCQFEYITHHSFTTNPNLAAENAHGMLLLFTLVIFYLMERQTEFNNKINFKWRVELIKKQHDGALADRSITILLHNILPAHVVNVYLTSLAKHELYYEDYEMVAVMFASLKNFQLDLPSLRVLNEIISEFDRILSYYREDCLVEKIKIVGCTYMAACGLDIRYSSGLSGLTDLTGISEARSAHSSIRSEVMRAKRSMALFNMDKTNKNEEVVFVLTTFALDLMRTLWICNNDYKNVPSDGALYCADMSIGISSGEVMAGVVGASQVHYDIWGNAVNMASRMDSTGVAGHIQVTDETADILRKCGLECNYRGMTYVKGRGILPTYFVGIDEQFEFKYTVSNLVEITDRSTESETEIDTDNK